MGVILKMEFGYVMLISIILTWGIGLFFPALIRYVIMRRPLSKKISIFIVLLNFVFNIAVFSITSGDGSYPVTALIAYFAYRILHKGYENENSGSAKMEKDLLDKDI